ncbi:MAG: LuxR C-terminal-related transcriptional regulator [Planctomycetota bacterium]
MNLSQHGTHEWLGQPSDGLIATSQWTEIAGAIGLSPRECEVAQLLFQGRTRQQIAEQLQITPRTVRHYLESLHDKLDVTNRVGVVLRLIQVRDRLPIGDEAEAASR